MKKFTTVTLSALTVYLIMAFVPRLEKNEPVTVLRTKITPELISSKIEPITIELKGHDAFLSKLGNFESGNDYKKVNRYGYMGKYQFGEQALDQVNIQVPKQVFLNSPELQEIAMQRLLEFNDDTLEKYISKYEGKKLHGVLVTHSGVLAAAHLGGPTNVKKWFRSGKVFKDGNGTPITKYMKIFSGYSLNID